MKRAFFLILILLIPLFTNGCWNRVELNELTVILGTAIDLEDDHWVTTFQVIIPQSIATQAGGGAAGGQSPVSVFSTKGKTLNEAIQNISLESSRKPFFAHNRVLLIGERVAKEKGVMQIVDFYLRDADSRETMDVVLSKGKASRLLEVLVPQEKVPAIGIERVFKQTERELSTMKRIRLSDFTAKLADPTANAILPEIRLQGVVDSSSSLDALKQARQSAVLKIGDTGIFKKDKLAGWMKREESIGIAWLTDEVQNALISFKCPENEESGEQSSFLVQRSSTKLKPVIKNGEITITAMIKANGELNEISCKLDLTKPEQLKKLEQQIKKHIEENIITSWNAAKKMKADIFGFGDVIHKKYPKQWKAIEPEWENKLTKVKLNLNIEIAIKRIGMINKPMSTLTEK